MAGLVSMYLTHASFVAGSAGHKNAAIERVPGTNSGLFRAMTALKIEKSGDIEFKHFFIQRTEE